jgi:hypothetical protein
MLPRLSILGFLFILVTCGSRTQTPDEGPYGQSGTSQGTGGVGVTTTGGSTGVGGSSTGNICGSMECPAGSLCCASCGICVSPDNACPDCSGGVGGGFPGTGGFYPGTGGTVSTGVGGFYPGTGGFYPGSGGAGGCNEPVGACVAQLQSNCPPNDVCTCSQCGCQAQACLATPGCQAVYRCIMQTNCTDPSSCYAQCGSVIMGNAPQFFPAAMGLMACGQSAGCPRCARPVPSFDAGTGRCSSPPPPTGVMQCSASQPGGSMCTQACGDGSNKYYTECANGTCSCNYDGREICRCTYQAQNGCYSCCPPWVAFAL